ncbi:MAG: ABC transporter ATP-binding protein [Ruminococcus sp.]|nr:ABC transporter ATP-binding protein [Ruminococcus sp.]
MENKEKILEVSNLTVSFKTNDGIVHAVRDVSFDLFKGETLAIVGESGSGKSVTSRSLMGLLTPNAIIENGTIMYEETDLLKLKEDQFHKYRGNKLGMVFQDPLSCLNPILKIGKQLTESMLLNEKISKADAKARALKLLAGVGIPDPERCYDRYSFELSGGMRQRVVIAIALSANPEILICDEPTTALDVTIQAQILELINEIKRERGLSVIFITHDMGVVANMADRIAVMYAGKIVEYGTAEEIFYSPAHPYTWALLASIPDLDTREKLESIPGTPPNMLFPPKGDAFAARNKYAIALDFEEQPPLFEITPTHYAATWLLHPKAPKVSPPEIVLERIRKKRELEEAEKREGNR